MVIITGLRPRCAKPAHWSAEAHIISAKFALPDIKQAQALTDDSHGIVDSLRRLTALPAVRYYPANPVYRRRGDDERLRKP